MKKIFPLVLTSASLVLAPTVHADFQLYADESSSFSTYGKLQMDFENYDGEGKFQNNGSRLGFKGEKELKHGLTGFARLEFRYDAAHRNKVGTDEDAELDIRNTYFGFRGGFGELKIGNFDSIISDLVTGQADLMENYGWRPLVSNSTHAHGSSLAYTLPEFVDGLEVALAVKHYASEDADEAVTTSDDGKQQFNFQFAANYQLTEEFSLGLGVDQNNKNVEHDSTTKKAKLSKDNGDTDPIFAVSALYEADAFFVGITGEKSGDFKAGHLTGGVSYGDDEVYFTASYNNDGDESGIDFVLGANYELGDNFWTYLEVGLGNDKNSDIQDEKDKGAYVATLGAAYKW